MYPVSRERTRRQICGVIEMLLEDGEPTLETEFIGTQVVVVA